MSNNNNKQPLDLTDSLPVDTGGLNTEDRVGQVNALKAEELQNQKTWHNLSCLRKHPALGKGLGIPKIKKPVAPRIPSQNDSLDIPASSSGTCQVM
ncbi:hypothetical protein Tco_0893258 [Tanacetum coccineum]|uniref:Uncharacterized protein n=1 Tax=Tanacetum coccineum TaxID=301880 RepID=A0ABQ5C8E9_9ASTR